MSEPNGPEKSGRGPIRLGLVQFDAKVENVDYNVQRVKDRIASLEPGTVDLLCLPEMSFTGYVFPTADSIRPFVEGPEGPSRAACAEIAQRLKCYVVAGYPAPTLTLKESEDQSGEGKSNETQETTAKVEGVARNNAIVVDPSGNVIHEYTKTNMFEADLPWAQPGSGFSTFSTPLEALGTISVAICMDLNPHPPNVWNSAEEGPYELADYCIERNVQTLILLCAWLDSGNEPEDTQFDAQTVSYWIARLRPLWHSGSDKYTVVICNRTGKERGSTFAGSSTVLRSQTDKQLPKILTIMGRDEEAVRVVDLE